MTASAVAGLSCCYGRIAEDAFPTDDVTEHGMMIDPGHTEHQKGYYLRHVGRPLGEGRRPQRPRPFRDADFQDQERDRDGDYAVAKGFRAAGRRLGVSGSAVSQTISQLEERLEVALFQRTTRTVRLTEAGQRLYAGVRPALREIEAVEEEVKELGTEPSGTLRLNVSHEAESVLGGTFLGDFLNAYPRVRLDLVVTAHTGEIVEAGFDAAVGLGEMIEQDMLAIPVSEKMRLTVVGSPGYFERHPVPEHPRELVEHVCINWASGAGEPPLPVGVHRGRPGLCRERGVPCPDHRFGPQPPSGPGRHRAHHHL